MVIPARGIRKVEFARLLGVSNSRVSQLIADGMPVELDDTIDEAAAVAWCRANVRQPSVMRLPPSPRIFTVTEDPDELARVAVEGRLSRENGSDKEPFPFADAQIHAAISLFQPALEAKKSEDRQP